MTVDTTLMQTTVPAGNDHGRVAAQIAVCLGTYVKPRGLGDIYGAETGFLIQQNPDTVLAPDCAFVRAERRVRGPAYFPGPPDLAFEVISPGDTYTEVEKKIQEWLRAGVPAVVIVDPRLRTVRIDRPAGTSTYPEVLGVEDIVPGWSVPISELFE